MVKLAIIFVASGSLPVNGLMLVCPAPLYIEGFVILSAAGGNIPTGILYTAGVLSTKPKLSVAA